MHEVKLVVKLLWKRLAAIMQREYDTILSGRIGKLRIGNVKGIILSCLFGISCSQNGLDILDPDSAETSLVLFYFCSLFSPADKVQSFWSKLRLQICGGALGKQCEGQYPVPVATSAIAVRLSLGMDSWIVLPPQMSTRNLC